jgi:hypothetical protein
MERPTAGENTAPDVNRQLDLAFQCLEHLAKLFLGGT